MNEVVLRIIIVALTMLGLAGCTIEPVRPIYTPTPVYQAPRYVAPAAPDPVYYLLPNGQVVVQQRQYHPNLGWRPLPPPPGAVIYFGNQGHQHGDGRHFGGRSPQHDDRRCMNAPGWHKDHNKYCH